MSPAADPSHPSAPRRVAVRRSLSPLTLRILAVNVMALALLAFGLLFLDRYQLTLVASELGNLKVEAELIAGSLGLGAVENNELDVPALSPDASRAILQRLVPPVRARAQMFGADGQLLLDSSLAIQANGQVSVLTLPAPENTGAFAVFIQIYDWIFNSLPRRDAYPLYHSALLMNATNLAEGARALAGDSASAVYRTPEGRLVFNVAVPIQNYRQVLGVLMLSHSSIESDEALRRVRLNILLIFMSALGVTVLLSIYLAGTIARPIRLLAAAAERTRQGEQRHDIPDFTRRGDEIGDLSAALRAMTDALWQRLEAIERFAADVAHEIKNPLTSLRSAVETAVRVKDPERQRQLLGIVVHDVKRLDRLITDISGASRLDAELARAQPERVDIGGLLAALVEVHQATHDPDDSGPVLTLEIDPTARLKVRAIEDRLVQVFQNLIANALSFSPPGGAIRIVVVRVAGQVRVAIEDDGPGIPEGKEEDIFERFYSERPSAESFGTHSGLGLSISRQIITAHQGQIRAENRLDRDGRVLGARFTVTLPAITTPTRPKKGAA